MFQREQIEKYAEIVFAGHNINIGRSMLRVKCPIHNGKDRNFAFSMERGVWTCHSHCGSGGMVQLEQRLHGGPREEATERLFKLLGMASEYQAKQIVCTYDYVDSEGKLLFQKIRLEPKDFRFRTPVGAKGYTYGSPTNVRPLYGLPGVITANISMIVEGEKDADTLNAMDWESGPMGKVYATTPGAADSWAPHHAAFMAGKKVLVFEDNDEKGRHFSKTVCESVFPFAHSVRLVRFQEMPEKSDVSDFVKEFGAAALIEKIKTSAFYAPPAVSDEPSTIVEGMQFAMSGDAETNWLIEGVIQAEGNGIVMGDPKAGKSLSVVDLIVCMISGTPWHKCNVKERVRVGLVTREDAPGLTKKRIQRLIRGKQLAHLDLDNWLWINSREQTKSFDICEDADFKRLVRDFKREECRIVFFDVFNRIHRLNENDNTEMAQITARLSQFGAEVGCQVALVHHINKDNGNTNIFNRLRGAGALHGWMEWGLAITTTNPEDAKEEWIRRIDFESKETTVDPIHFLIKDGPGWTTLESTKVESAPVRPSFSDRKTRSTGGSYAN